jgi:hypothetical protein
MCLAPEPALRKRAPNERNELRLRGLYVDPDDDTTQAQAYRFLTGAANDYATASQIVEPELHVVDDARFYEALANWPECPLHRPD